MSMQNRIGRTMGVVGNHDEAKRDLLLALNDVLMQTTTEIPENGYGDGYDVIHVIANHDERLYDIKRDDPPLHPTIPAEELVDRTFPYWIEVGHAQNWEDIETVVGKMLNYVDDGMTQGVIVWRHDPERARLGIQSPRPPH